MVKTTSQTKPGVVAQLDSSVRPQDNFFGYVNNVWLKANPIPPSESQWGTFWVLCDQAMKNTKNIYDELQNAPDGAPGNLEQKARDFYYTGMHMDDLEATHLKLIKRYFASIDAVASPKDLAGMIGELHAIGVAVPWGIIMDADDKNSTKHILRLHQGGLVLPDRDYYLEDTPKMQDIRAAYKTHLKEVHSFFPELAESDAQLITTVLDFETQLAKISRSATALRDIEKAYNKTTYAQLQDTYAAIDWPTYATAYGWQPDDKICVDQPEFMAFINKQFTERPLNEWKIYLKWHFLAMYYGRISERFASLRFEFFGKILGGTTELMPLWKRVVGTLDYTIGEASGRLYAERHFSESSKQTVLGMVEDLRAAYKERIQNLDWMTEPTKAYALQKLAKFKVLIGYPDKWRDFSNLTIGRESYIENIMAAERFNNAYWLKRLHEAPSRDEWQMNPQTVNAYHDWNRLVICFPAAILQPPFFDPNAHIAANLGGIGAVIGHELTHGFDDQGCQFDAEGNVRQWQANADRDALHARAQTIIDQADAFEVAPGQNMKGNLIIGESIADLGGVEIAYHALHSKLGDQINQEVDGQTATQRFFINFATAECGDARDQAKRQLALTDPHPDSRFRVNGMVQHVDSFYEAFNVKQGDALYRPPNERAKIW